MSFMTNYISELEKLIIDDDVEKPKKKGKKKKRPVGDKKQKAQSSSSYSDEVLEYYSGEEVKQIYKWIEDGVAAIRN